MSGEGILNCEKVLQFYLKKSTSFTFRSRKKVEHCEINCRIHYQTLQTVKNYRKIFRKRKKEGISKQIESEKHQGFNFQKSIQFLDQINHCNL